MADALSLPHNLSRVLIVPHAGEGDMPQVLTLRPFQELNLSDSLGPEPDTFLHLGSGETITPSSSSLLRQVGEWTDVSAKPLELSKDLPAAGRDKAIANPAAVTQFPASVEANDESINAVVAGSVSSDDKLLRQGDALLLPCASAQACLVGAGESFCDHAFKRVFPNKVQDYGERETQSFRELKVARGFDETLEPRPPFTKLTFEKRAVVQIQQVEGVEDGRSVHTSPILKQLEAGNTFVSQSTELTVDHTAEGQAFSCSNNVGELTGQDLCVPREDSNASAVVTDLSPVSVQLDLVKPVVSLGEGSSGHALHGRSERDEVSGHRWVDAAKVAQRFRETPIDVLRELIGHMQADELQVKVSADVTGGLRGDSVRLVLTVSEKERVR